MDVRERRRVGAPAGVVVIYHDAVGILLVDRGVERDRGERRDVRASVQREAAVPVVHVPKRITAMPGLQSRALRGRTL